MNNECGKTSPYSTRTCERSRNHGGDHRTYNERGVLEGSWPQTPAPAYYEYKVPFAKGGVSESRLRAKVTGNFSPDEHSVLLTLEDLKVLSFFMSRAGKEQAPETAAKIDKALKGAL